MFIAHLPAGYILSRVHPALRRNRLWIMLGATVPDADLLVAIFVHHGTVHHHSYLSHRPAFWLALCLLGLLLGRYRFAKPLAALGLGGLLHVSLDSVAGAIAWGWPLSAHVVPLVVVPATQDWWVMSFVLHWTFVVEVLICSTTLILWWRG